MADYTLTIDGGTFEETGTAATLTWANGSAMSLSDSLPLLTMSGLSTHTGADILISLPLSTSALNVISSDLASINITLGWPAIDNWSASLVGGGSLQLTLPPLSMSQHILVAAAMNIAAEINLFDALLEGSGENLGHFDLEIPELDASINVQSEIIGHISGALPRMRMAGTGKTGVVGNIDFDLPMVYYDSVLLSQGIIALDITLPALVLDSYGTYDDVTITYRVLVANTRNFGMTEYPSCEYDSMALFNGNTLAVRGNTIVKLGAALDQDQPIEALLQTGTLDFSNPVWMMPRDVWITLRSGKKVQVTVKPDEGPEEDGFSYESENFIPVLRKTRAKLGRGLNAGYYDFMIENISGEYIDIEGIHVHSMAIGGKKR